MAALKKAIAGTREKLAKVRATLFKRRARVRFCKMKMEACGKKARAYQKIADDVTKKKVVREEARLQAEHWGAKHANWHELLDKATLGRKEFEKREALLRHKLNVLAKKLDKLQREQQLPAEGVSVPDRPWNPYKRPICNWIIPWLDKVWALGVHFVVTSGFRSDQTQCQTCIGVCGNCGGCPGRCAAPGTSNHRGTAYPLGAVDVTNYYAVGAALRRVGSPLHNSLPTTDPVHMSATGR